MRQDWIQCRYSKVKELHRPLRDRISRTPTHDASRKIQDGKGLSKLLEWRLEQDQKVQLEGVCLNHQRLSNDIRSIEFQWA